MVWNPRSSTNWWWSSSSSMLRHVSSQWLSSSRTTTATSRTTMLPVMAFSTTTTTINEQRRRFKRQCFIASSSVSSFRAKGGGPTTDGTSTRLFSVKVDETSSEEVTKTDEKEKTTTTTRLSRGAIEGLDLRVVVDHLDVVLSHLTSRHASEEVMTSAKLISELNSERVKLIRERDLALSERKSQSDIVGKLMRETKGGNDSTDEQMAQLEEARTKSNEAAQEADAADTKLASIETRMNEYLSGIPNVLDDVVPEGLDDTENELVSEWGDVKDLQTKLKWDSDFVPLWHDEIAMQLNGWMAEEAVKISGTRFVALSGPVARLERALGQFFIDMHVQKGYTEVNVPYVVSRTTLEGTSQLPKFEDDLFKITSKSHTCNGEDAFLIPTAEVPLTNLYRDSILDESDLPMSFVSLTPCFRAEAGSAGRDTRGLVRTHQFHKVELVKITRPQDSAEQHELLTTHAEDCLKALELPYRKVRLCAGDIGFSARHCYDLEVWLPGQQLYREISSCSNTGDFQSKRMNLRYRPKPEQQDGKGKPKKVKPVPCHTINGSGLAVGRALVAVLENYQTPEGNVVVPDVLRPYMGGLELLEAPAKK